jgi:hypothetical protein
MTNEELAGKIELILSNQAEVREDVTVVKEILTGNGDPTKGLVVRFDRVEQSFLSNKKFGMAMLIAGGTGVLSLIGSLVLFGVRLKWGI